MIVRIALITIYKQIGKKKHLIQTRALSYKYCSDLLKMYCQSAGRPAWRKINKHVATILQIVKQLRVLRI